MWGKRKKENSDHSPVVGIFFLVLLGSFYLRGTRYFIIIQEAVVLFSLLHPHSSSDKQIIIGLEQEGSKTPDR
jgi:hypothetical protein